MKPICRFCDIVKNSDTSSRENEIIIENESFFSLASIGPLVEGWVLVCPKEHMISLKDTYNQDGFKNIVNDLLSKMSKRYGMQIIAFEHGPNKCDSKTSCGTNHAHLHLVPYHQSLFPDMLATGLTWMECEAKKIHDVVGGEEYLFYCELLQGAKWENPKGFLHILKSPISQYFRNILSKQLACVAEYDYKKYPRIEVAIETIHALREIAIH